MHTNLSFIFIKKMLNKHEVFFFDLKNKVLREKTKIIKYGPTNHTNRH